MYIGRNQQGRRAIHSGTQFTCFTGTKVQILIQKELTGSSQRGRQGTRRHCQTGTQFTCFTGTKVQILTQKALQSGFSTICEAFATDMESSFESGVIGTHHIPSQAEWQRNLSGARCTCFTSTKVQILTQKLRAAGASLFLYQGLGPLLCHMTPALVCVCVCVCVRACVRARVRAP